jgi:2-oxoglutarate dehydrogenase E1 component
MANFQDSFLNGANIDFIEGLYARYLEDPASVDPSWRDVFAQHPGGRPLTTETSPAPRPGSGSGNGHAVAPAAQAGAPARPAAAGAQALATQGDFVSSAVMGLQARVDQTVYAFRLRGHLLAQLDPLGRPRPVPQHIADLGMVSDKHFTEAELDQMVDSNEVFAEKRVRLRDLLARLRRTYCGKVGVEFMNLQDSERRRWLMPRMEQSENRVQLSAEEQKRVLEKLSFAAGFEHFLHTKYVGQKRFALDGGESLIPAMDAFLQRSADLGVREVVIGMAHRGRLNVLTNVMGKAPDAIFTEFDGPKDPALYFGRGDVKYHMGFSSDYPTLSGQNVHLSLAFNPSHLEAVNPVVEGRVRAKQERAGDEAHARVVPFLIHGDAAVIGQGVVAETLNLAGLKGYTTGGTIHVVINNQVGFTTDPEDARSSIYCTALALMLDIPIFHVNADDPEACVHVMRLAAEYRQTFKSDVMIDLVCFRRYGHNEGDEPAFTQPKMYEVVRSRGGIRELYAKQLVTSGRLSEAEADAIHKRAQEEYEKAHGRAKATREYKGPSFLEGLWKNYKGGPDRDVPEQDTGVPKERLVGLLKQLASLPEGFTPHRDVQRTVISYRQTIADEDRPFAWTLGENLAYASLVTEGVPVRLSGQDVERGTFSHRHAVVHDVNTGQRHTALQKLSEKQAPFHIYNSPLSEFACMGFEYGYSLDTPDGLVIWEAQFGDFANNAQVVIDQFIAAGEAKWKRLSGLVLLLPHGYEGAGPEHSSARLERFLDLCADDNIQVAYPTTPAQMFHLLRRQALRPWRKPLVVMTPKSLLRAPHAQSTLDELSRGRFQRVIGEGADFDFKGATRMLLCSGKVYYDLAKARAEAKDTTTALVRVEQLFPFPQAELDALVASMPKLKEIHWVQEETQNGGAWHFMYPRLHLLAAKAAAGAAKVGYIGRAPSASPATGLTKAHELEQKLITDTAFARSA